MRLRGLLGGVNAGDPHLLKEERQFVAVWRQPLRVQRSMKTQTQSPTRVGRVLQPGFLPSQTAAENTPLCVAEARPPKVRASGSGPIVGGGARVEWTVEGSLEARLQTAGGQGSIWEPINITVQGKWRALIKVCLGIDRS